MPLLSPSMTEGTLVHWLKKEGDAVKSGEVIAEVETDKATMDLEAFDSGILRKIIVPEGAKVAVNARIAVIGAKDEVIDEALLQPTPGITTQPAASAGAAKTTTSMRMENPNAASSSPAKTSAAIPPQLTPATTSYGRAKASPLAKKIAKESGVSMATLTGTGPGGRITKRDVLSGAGQGGGGSWALTPPGSIAKDERIPLSNMRQVIARRLVESKTQIPHYYLEIDINAKPLLDLRVSLNDAFDYLEQSLKLSLNDFIMKASVESLRRVPIVNASFDGDAIRQHGSVHLSFAVSIHDGLITPVIRDAQNKNLKQISLESRVLAVKARDGKLKPEEYQGGTFTITNLGMLGIDNFSAVINPPQAAILAIGNVVKQPVVNEHDEITVGHRLRMTMSCDHRVVDGAVGAAFLKELRTLLENPAVLLL
jgi:pyruvate dehydrogenase E2 component (dihydrolipoamide acetyltransferase)